MKLFFIAEVETLAFSRSPYKEDVFIGVLYGAISAIYLVESKRIVPVGTELIQLHSADVTFIPNGSGYDLKVL